ncbi:MAG: methyltransferase domain-containing protein, partial [Candidatus Eremiobacteraeota bacterium]|nr:methyltransferase domain-containing protein [Candidatus Eremiobacteraeota bacterium]
MINPKMKRLTDSLERDEKVEGSSSLALLLDMVGSGKRVLEFGCGRGPTSRALTAAGNRVVGIEIDGTLAAEARGSCEEVVQADLDARPLAELVPNRTFDVAVFGNVLEYLRDPRAVLEETRRFLGPGGYAVLAIPNVAHVSIRLALLRGRFDMHGSNPLERSYLRFFTLKSITELCFGAGFRIVEIERVKASPFASEGSTQTLKPGDFDREIMREIESDPEHDTTQFVLRAAPLGDDERLAALVDIAVEAELRWNDARSKLSNVEDEARAFERRIAELEERIAHEASARAVAEEAVAVQRARGDELAERVRLANESARGHERRQEEVAALRGALERASGELADLRESATQARDSFDAEIARLQEIARE